MSLHEYRVPNTGEQGALISTALYTSGPVHTLQPVSSAGWWVKQTRKPSKLLVIPLINNQAESTREVIVLCACEGKLYCSIRWYCPYAITLPLYCSIHKYTTNNTCSTDLWGGHFGSHRTLVSSGRSHLFGTFQSEEVEEWKEWKEKSRKGGE